LQSGILGLGQWAGRSPASSSTTGWALSTVFSLDIRDLSGRPGSDRHEPVAVALVAPGDDVEEQRLQLLGDRSAPPVPDRPVVELPDRGDLGRRPGEEGLVGDVHLVARDALLDHVDAEVAGDGDDRVAGNAVEAARQVRGVEPAVADDEDVLAGTFGHV